MGNVTISATTANACGCCGAAPASNVSPCFIIPYPSYSDMPWPFGTTEFANEASAQQNIDDCLISCRALFADTGQGGSYTILSESLSGSTFTMRGKYETATFDFASVVLECSVNTNAASSFINVDVNPSGTGDGSGGVSVELYDDAGNVIDFYSGAFSSVTVSFTNLSNARYVVACTTTAGSETPAWNDTTYTITSNTESTFCGVNAKYSGGYLNAC